MKTSAIRNTFLLISTCLVFMALPLQANAQSVTYTVEFDATWTEVTHPTDFPPNPHFSGLVGGTHDNSVSFWETGQLASLGMKRMAEWGSQTELLAEVQAAINAGQAETAIAGPGLGSVPGTVSTTIELTPEFPLVTLVSMIAPSPDWFIGVRNLDLRPGGIWAEEIVVELFAYDAGTDSGPSYTSPDQPTNPPDPIAAITGYPFTEGIPLGTYTFSADFVADVPEVTSFTAIAYPNPFNPQTTIAWELPAAGQVRLDIFDIAGRHIRHLRDGAAQAGPDRTQWNGRNDSGQIVAAGPYYFRMEYGGRFLTQKLTLVK